MAVLDQPPDLSEQLRDAGDATKRALFHVFDMRVTIECFLAERVFGPMGLDLLREQLDLQERTSHTETHRTAARLQAQILKLI